MDPNEQNTLALVETALRLVCISLPHLAGLAHQIEPVVEARCPTVGVFASGRMVVNPDWFQRLNRAEATFVVAHELLHLALATHDRLPGSEPLLFNIAHDYIINDMLERALNQDVPAGGLKWSGEKPLAEFSAESLVARLRRQNDLDAQIEGCRWRRRRPGSGSPMRDALRAAGLVAERPADRPADRSGDVLSDRLERQWYPGLEPVRQQHRGESVRQAAAAALSLGVIQDRLREIFEEAGTGRGMAPDQLTVLGEALATAYRPPWELALQQWLEAVMPGPRTYSRPSRRQAVSTDMALAGRKREGWTLHIVLDTSGSMASEFGRLLGLIASFCEGANVGQAHVLQCDAAVTRDETVTPDELRHYVISGLGGSNLSPALQQLARDPEVEAVIVLTDGDIFYPEQPTPYQTLWVLTAENAAFQPGYGKVIVLDIMSQAC